MFVEPIDSSPDPVSASAPRWFDRRAPDAWSGEGRNPQIEKLIAIGLMAGNVAHDLNNLLQAVSARLELLSSRAIDHHVDVQRAQSVVTKGKRAVQTLLAFIRESPPHEVVADPAEVLQNTAALLKLMLPPKVAVMVRPEPGVWPIRTDVNQLQLAIINLAINARDAMPDGGQLVLATANRTVAEPLPQPARDCVAITVADNGTGMTPEVAARVAEPFFTTKGPTQGTGLGLAQVTAFVRRSGGDLIVQTELGLGTKMTLLLPRCHTAAEPSIPAGDPFRI